jgi:type I restriction enzyme S subunit
MIENNNKWRKITIGDLGKIVTGKTPSTKNDTFWNGDIPFVTPADLQKTKHIFSTERTVSQDGLTAVKGATLPTGAICVSCIGNLGYTAMTTQVSVSNQQINSIIPSDDFDKNFVYYLMKSLWDEFKNLEGQSTTLSILNKTLFSKMEVIVPDVNTQKKIAKVLSSLDDKIELNTQINHNLEEQAKAIFKSWFVDFEPFNGKMPKSWLAKTLADVSKIGAGGDKPHCVSEIQTPEFQYPIYSNGLANDGLYGYASSAKIHEESITVSARGTIGFVCLRQEPYVPIVRLITLIPNTCFVSAKYLYLYLKGINISGTGTTQQQLTVPDFQKTSIMVPDNDTMKRFTICADSIFEQIKHNAKEMRTLAQLRDALLPKLMSGEIDVSEVEV